ncbi:CHRD domain-containing protein [Brumimicrobium mesophilum]|uniref:CHRD domain-containing protein n=1 Tax=Brumimicrobium mesophilum TaxID=392717 RepID=UPI001F3E09CB|nr:CHRD domain-containing protein [Brumimicrobium mesophilum]
MKNLQKIAIAAILTVSTSAMSFAAHLGDQLTFSARMNGAQEVPAVTTTGQGVATMVLNGTRDTLCVSIYTAGVPETIMGLHLHSGVAGTNGGVVVDLTPYIIDGNVKAVLTGSALTSSLISDMITGGIYVNAHTASNMDGEIRGQVKLETDFPYRATLDGSQEVPMVSTMATGLGVFNLSLDKKKLMYWVSADGLSGPIMGAHLHMAAAGANGAVVVDLTPTIMGNAIVGVADVSGVAGFANDLEAGDIYINVHTAANMDGEIRGQLTYDNQVAFDGVLSGDQEVPAVSTMATGVVKVSLSSDFSTINYSAQVEGLSGAIMGAHFHNEAAGANGPVVVDLTGDVNGNIISGTITGAAVTQDLIREFLEGNIYLNVHTAANMGGEIRAQISRVAREGYSVNLSGDQEVPSVSTMANGGGIITISRERNNAHVMIVVKELSGTIDAAHIHNAVAGMNGGVEFNLSSWFSMTENYDGAFGYLTSDSPMPMNAAAETKFRNNEMYVNIHTAANPDGEVRGQVLRGSECSQEFLGLSDNELEENNLTAYPNPTTDKITLSFEKFNGEMNVQVVDIYGKTVQTKSIKSNNTTIDMSGLPSGVYMIKAESQITRVIKK